MDLFILLSKHKEKEVSRLYKLEGMNELMISIHAVYCYLLSTPKLLFLKL